MLFGCRLQWKRPVRRLKMMLRTSLRRADLLKVRAEAEEAVMVRALPTAACILPVERVPKETIADGSMMQHCVLSSRKTRRTADCGNVRASRPRDGADTETLADSSTGRRD